MTNKSKQMVLESILPSYNAWLFTLILMGFDICLNSRGNEVFNVQIAESVSMTNHLFSPILYFGSRYLILMLLFSCTLGFLERSFYSEKVKRFYLGVSLYIFVFFKIRSPYLFDAFGINQWLEAKRVHFGENFFFVFSILMAIYLIYILNKIPAILTKKMAGTIILLGILGSNFLTMASIEFRLPKLEYVDSTSSRQNLFIILIDSLNQDSDQTILSNSNTSTKIFMQKSKRYKNVISAGIQDSVLNELRASKSEFDLLDDRTTEVGFTSVVVTTFFNNFFGQIILPEMFMNTSFSTMYSPGPTSRSLIESASRILRLSLEPKIIVFHLSAMSAPRNSNYPYSKSLHFKTDSVAIEADFHSGVDMITNQFLNPIFDFLKNSGELDRSRIVLMSNRSATSTTCDESLLFSARTEKLYQRESKPEKSSGQLQEQAFQSHNIIKQIFEKKAEGDDDFSFSATKTDPFNNSLARLFSGFSNNYNEYKNSVDKDDGRNQAMFFERQAVYYKNFRLTIYPTAYGAFQFLCDLENDRSCSRNLEWQEPSIYRKMFAQLASHLEGGERKKSLAGFHGVDLLPTKGKFTLAEISGMINSRSEWIRFMGLSVAYHDLHAFQYAQKNLTKLYFSTQNSRLKQHVFSMLRHLCANRDFDPVELAAVERDHVNFEEADWEPGKAVFSCQRQSALTLFPEQALTQNSFANVEDIDSLIVEGNLKNYFMERRESRFSDPRKNIYSALKALGSNEREKISHLALDHLETRFVIEKNYQLSAALAPYFFTKFAILFATDKTMAAQIILKDLRIINAGVEFEAIFFAYLNQKLQINFDSEKSSELRDYRQRDLQRFSTLELP